jgi:LAO/AO transport system kinase
LQGIVAKLWKWPMQLSIINQTVITTRKSQVKVEFNRALYLFPAKSGLNPTVSTCSSISKEGIDVVWETITSYLELTNLIITLMKTPRSKNQYWMMEPLKTVEK